VVFWKVHISHFFHLLWCYCQKGVAEVNHAGVVKELTHALLTFSTLRAQMSISVYRYTEILNNAARTLACASCRRCYSGTQGSLFTCLSLSFPICGLLVIHIIQRYKNSVEKMHVQCLENKNFNTSIIQVRVS
jgi:hypothetical protein